MTELLDLVDGCINDGNALAIQVALETFLSHLSSAACCIVRSTSVWAEVMFHYCCVFAMLCDSIHPSLSIVFDEVSRTAETQLKIRRMGNLAKRSLEIFQSLMMSESEIPWSQEEIRLELDALNASSISERVVFTRQSLSRSTTKSESCLLLSDADLYL